MSIESQSRPARSILSGHRVLAGGDPTKTRQRNGMTSTKDHQSILTACSQHSQNGSPRERGQARIPELCEEKTMLLLSQLRLIRPVSFPAISQEDRLQWSTLIAWLQDTLAHCEAEFKRSITERRSDQAARQSVPLQEAISIMKSLKGIVRVLPSGAFVHESDRLCLHKPGRLTAGNQRVLLDTSSLMVADLQNGRVEAAVADFPAGRHGYRALLSELMELGVIEIRGKEISVPDSPGLWQSTLDALEGKLMNHSRKIDQGQLPLPPAERQTKLSQAIRLRGWIMSARRQHAGTMQRGYYYRPDP